ncbi:MAG: histidine phosphatase family protein [Novosphingobium sp.]
MLRTVLVAAMLIAVFQTASASAATFLFIRHAESTSNVGRAATIEEAIDPPLTNKGRQQALELASVLAEKSITKIYVSAYQRTGLTIAPTADRLRLTPIIDARTNEWHFGDMSSLADMQDASIGSIVRSWAAGNTAAKAALPKAESLDDMAARVLPAWTQIFDAHKDDDGVVVLVGHGAETGFVMPYFAKNVTPAFAFANGMRNTGIIEVEIMDGKPVVTKWQGIAVPAQAAVPEPAH